MKKMINFTAKAQRRKEEGAGTFLKTNILFLYPCGFYLLRLCAFAVKLILQTTKYPQVF